MTAQEKIEMEHRITETEARSKSNMHRIENLEKNNKIIQDLTVSIAQQTEQMKTMTESVSEIKTDVKALQGQPQKTITTMKTAIITAITSLIFGLISAGITALITLAR